MTEDNGYVEIADMSVFISACDLGVFRKSLSAARVSILQSQQIKGIGKTY